MQQADLERLARKNDNANIRMNVREVLRNVASVRIGASREQKNLQVRTVRWQSTCATICLYGTSLVYVSSKTAWRCSVWSV
jgi:hypothetical protein